MKEKKEMEATPHWLEANSQRYQKKRQKTREDLILAAYDQDMADARGIIVSYEEDTRFLLNAIFTVMIVSVVIVGVLGGLFISVIS